MSAFLQSQRLPHPVRITEHVWPEGTVPVVSVFCITYNHVNFIREAIEGFLMQETTFPVEIFIHDDASTDGTAGIVKDYAEKYPKLFWTVLQKENQYSKERFKFFFDYLFQQRGEFIALCEGDDYWTSPSKLQEQFDCLENYPNSSGVVHWVYDESVDGVLAPPPESSGRDWAGLQINPRDLLARNVVTTTSILFRSAMRPEFSDRYAKLPMGDWPLWIRLTLRGPLTCLPKRMAVYRVHGRGAWTGRSFFEHATGSLSMFPVIADDLPADLQPCAWDVCAELIYLAAINFCADEPLRQFTDFVDSVADAIKSAVEQITFPEHFEKPMDAQIERAVFNALIARANAAWNERDFIKARQIFGVLWRSPRRSFAIGVKWSATFLGDFGLILNTGAHWKPVDNKSTANNSLQCKQV